MSDPWSDRQRRHFDEAADTYRHLYGQETPFHDAMTARLLQVIAPRPGERVLDVGCGFGRLSLPLLRAGCRVSGLDISQPTLEALRARAAEQGLAERFTPRIADLEALEDEGGYDLVTGRGILHHLADPVAALGRLHRALKPGGRAVFMDPNPLNPAWLPFILLHPTLSWALEKRYLRHTPARSVDMLRRAGFADLDHAFLGLLPPPLWGRLPGAAVLEDRLAALPGLGALSMYIVISGRRDQAAAG